MKYWTHSITLVQGCSPAKMETGEDSPGCLHCWSKGMEYQYGGYSDFLKKTVCLAENSCMLCDKVKRCRNFHYTLPQWNGEIRLRPDRLPELLKGKKPRVIQIWNDLMHEQCNEEFISDAYYHFAKTTHTVLVLTKRAKRMSEILGDVLPSPNIWNGCTTELQRTADERIPYLLQVPGKRWLSIEPCLSDINVLQYLLGGNQVIVGCETGPHARPCKTEWIQSIVEQCKQAGVPVFVKAVNINGKITSDITKFPESLRVREAAWQR